MLSFILSSAATQIELKATESILEVRIAYLCWLLIALAICETITGILFFFWQRKVVDHEDRILKLEAAYTKEPSTKENLLND